MIVKYESEIESFHRVPDLTDAAEGNALGNKTQ
jgi:hypothetical protein